MPDLGTFEHDNLFAGHVQPVNVGVETITGGAAYTRGTVLGMITASELCKPVDNAQTDGSQVIYAILAEDTDATGGDVDAPVYYTGEFNSRKLTFGGDDTAADHRVAARKIGLFFKDTVPA